MRLAATIFIGVTLWLVAREARAQDVMQPPAPAECQPACRTGFFCQAGQCVSACNPPCDPGTVCTESAGRTACVVSAPAGGGYASQGYRPQMYSGMGEAPVAPHRVHVQNDGLVIAGWVTFLIGYAVPIPFWIAAASAYSSSGFAPVYGGTAIALGLLPLVNGIVPFFLPLLAQIVGIVLLVVGYVGHDTDVVTASRSDGFRVAVTPIVGPNTAGLGVDGAF